MIKLALLNDERWAKLIDKPDNSASQLEAAINVHILSCHEPLIHE